MTESSFVRTALRIVSGGVLLFLYLPLVVLAIYAFNPSRTLAWPPTGITMDWWVQAVNNPRII